MLTPFTSAIKELLQQIHQIDEHTEFKNWKASNKNLPNLSASSELPDSLPGFKKFFDKLYFPKNTSNGATIYPNILLGHDVPLNKI